MLKLISLSMSLIGLLFFAIAGVMVLGLFAYIIFDVLSSAVAVFL